MTPLTRTTEAQIDALIKYYESKHREKAIVNLIAAVLAAQIVTSVEPDTGLPAPRPYRQLAQPGEKWIKKGSYWVHYQLEPLVIAGVYHEKMDIPSRIEAIREAPGS